MVMIKNGKPVVPNPNNSASKDIARPAMNMNYKVDKVMKVPTEKIDKDPYVLATTNRGSNMKGSSDG